MKRHRVASAVVVVALLLASPAARSDPAKCAARLHVLYAGFVGYAFEHGGRMPSQLSELDYLAFVDNLEAYVCPDSRTELTVRTDIDALTDYEIVSQTLPSDRVIVIAREKEPRHGGKRHLLYSDGTVALEGEDPSTGVRAPAGGVNGGATRPGDVTPGGGGTQPGAGGTQPGGGGVFAPPPDGRFTGLLIDASGLGIRRSMSAHLLDDTGAVFYPDPRLSNQVPAKGWLGFINSPDEAARSRAGESPFIVRALRESTNRPGDVLLTREDVDRIRIAEGRSGFLDDWNVTLLIGDVPMPQGPTPAGAEGPPLGEAPGDEVGNRPTQPADDGGAPPVSPPGGGGTPTGPADSPGTTRWNLTGEWRDDLNRQYQIRQIGDEVYWSMEDRPRIVTSFYGLIEDDVLAGERVDVPGGEAKGSGVLTVRVESNDRMTRIQDATHLGASEWTRAVAPPARVDTPDSPDQPDTPTGPDLPERPVVQDGGLPAGLSVGEGLQVARWFSVRRLTKLTRDDGLKINNARISADGSRVIFSTYNGTYTIGTDGSGMTKISDVRNAGVIDLSADGRRVAWSDYEGLWSANADGSAKVCLSTTFLRCESIRITASGDRVYALHQGTGGIYSMPTDGSDTKRLVNTEQVAETLGIGPNRNHWIRTSLDLSDDASRVVFQFGHDAFAINGDGTGLRRLTPAQDRRPSIANVHLSGNGETVIYTESQGIGEKSIRVLDWNGQEKLVYPGLKYQQLWSQLSRDGSKFGVSWGMRIFDTSRPSEVDVFDLGGNYTRPNYRAQRASWTADFRRACVIVQGSKDDRKGVNQLTLVDFDPLDLAGVPHLENIDVRPRFLLTDTSSSAVVTMKVTDPAAEYAALMLLRDGRRGARYTYYESLKLNDAGQDGDKAAGDGTFTTGQLRLYKDGGKEHAAGPLELRVCAWNSDAHALIVDVEGLEARAP